MCVCECMYVCLYACVCVFVRACMCACIGCMYFSEHVTTEAGPLIKQNETDQRNVRILFLDTFKLSTSTLKARPI